MEQHNIKGPGFASYYAEPGPPLFAYLSVVGCFLHEISLRVITNGTNFGGLGTYHNVSAV